MPPGSLFGSLSAAPTAPAAAAAGSGAQQLPLSPLQLQQQRTALPALARKQRQLPLQSPAAGPVANCADRTNTISPAARPGSHRSPPMQLREAQREPEPDAEPDAVLMNDASPVKSSSQSSGCAAATAEAGAASPTAVESPQTAGLDSAAAAPPSATLTGDCAVTCHNLMRTSPPAAEHQQWVPWEPSVQPPPQFPAERCKRTLTGKRGIPRQMAAPAVAAVSPSLERAQPPEAPEHGTQMPGTAPVPPSRVVPALAVQSAVSADITEQQQDTALRKVTRPAQKRQPSTAGDRPAAGHSASAAGRTASQALTARPGRARAQQPPIPRTSTRLAAKRSPLSNSRPVLTAAKTKRSAAATAARRKHVVAVKAVKARAKGHAGRSAAADPTAVASRECVQREDRLNAPGVAADMATSPIANPAPSTEACSPVSTPAIRQAQEARVQSPDQKQQQQQQTQPPFRWQQAQAVVFNNVEPASPSQTAPLSEVTCTASLPASRSPPTHDQERLNPRQEGRKPWLTPAPKGQPSAEDGAGSGFPAAAGVFIATPPAGATAGDATSRLVMSASQIWGNAFAQLEVEPSPARVAAAQGVQATGAISPTLPPIITATPAAAITTAAEAAAVAVPDPAAEPSQATTAAETAMESCHDVAPPSLPLTRRPAEVQTRSATQALETVQPTPVALTSDSAPQRKAVALRQSKRARDTTTNTMVAKVPRAGAGGKASVSTVADLSDRVTPQQAQVQRRRSIRLSCHVALAPRTQPQPKRMPVAATPTTAPQVRELQV